MQRWTGLVFALLIVVSGGVSTAIGETRNWRDISGQYSRQAEFVALRGGEVHLRLADGRGAKVALDKLSIADREYVAEATKPKVADPFVMVASNEVKTVQAVLKSERLAQAEMIPSPVADATFAAMQDTEAAAGEEVVDYRRIRKFVYYGCYSTTHLIDLSPTSGYGTIHYCLKGHHHDHGCCGPHCTWYLAYLRKFKEDPIFLYYRPLYVDPYIDLWAFAKRPTCCGSKYRIWFRERATGRWYKFDCASLVHPK